MSLSDDSITSSLPQWQSLPIEVPEEKPRTELAVAQVDVKGKVLSISNVGKDIWGIKEGMLLPSYFLKSLQEEATEEGEVYNLQLGALKLEAIRLYKEDGWLVLNPSQEIPFENTRVFKSLIENIPLLLLRVQTDGKIISLSGDGATTLGFSDINQLENRLLMEIIHPEDRWRLTSALREANTGQHLTIGVRFQNIQDETRFAEIHLFPCDAEDTDVEAIVFDITEQEIVEEALFLSESLYRTFLEQSPLGIIHLDAIGIVTFESHRFRELVGEEAENAWLGYNIHTLTHFGDTFTAQVAEMLQSGTAFQGLKVTFRKQEELYHLLIHGSGIYHPNGELVGGVLLIEDISKQYHQELVSQQQDVYNKAISTLREVFFLKEEHKSFLEDAIQVFATVSNADQAYILLTSSVDATYLCHAAWLKNSSDENALDAINTHDYPVLVDALSQRQTGHYLATESVRADQILLLERVNAKEMLWIPFFENGIPFGFVVLSHMAAPPFWQQKEVELIEKLVHSFETLWGRHMAEVRYNQTIAAIDECLFNYEFSKEGKRRYTFITPQIENLSGYEITDFQGKQAIDWIEQVVLDSYREDVYAHDERLKNGGESVVSYQILKKDGKIAWMHENANTNQDASQRTSIGGILMDITDQKVAESALVEAKKVAETASELKSAFIATMSHEIRTPLGAVNGFAELLAREISEVENKISRPMPPQVTEFVNAIRDNSQKLLNLVSDLFDLANLELGAISMRSVSVPLHEALIRATSSVAVTLSQKDVDLDLNLSPEDPVVLGDPKRVQQVLENILENAAKFTEEGTVTVSTRIENNRAIIECNDTGVGMSEEYIHQLFTPFLQEDRRLNRRFQGTGLGLALVKRILDRMGGEIAVESKKDIGSIFRISLPLADGNWNQ